ncbi:MAG: 30S ribosome-binding factor RbfA [Candidatus Eremiobacteraeota bacterium]|nr:30S ribosome-binding factor RbfA [Candidatus Eremiobacteraeota bacterium]
MKKERLGRIDTELQRALSKIISEQMDDPRMAFTTVTRVEVTQDLHHARVFVAIIGDRHAVRLTMDALKSASRFLRGELGHAVILRHTPELLFVEDRNTEHAIALTKVIESTQRTASPQLSERTDDRK